MKNITKVVAIGVLMILSIASLSCADSKVSEEDLARVYDVTVDYYQIEYDLVRTNTVKINKKQDSTVEADAPLTRNIRIFDSEYILTYEKTQDKTRYYRYDANENFYIRVGFDKTSGSFIEFDTVGRDAPGEFCLKIDRGTSSEKLKDAIKAAFGDVAFSNYAKCDISEWSEDGKCSVLWYNEIDGHYANGVGATVNESGAVESFGVNLNGVDAEKLNFNINMEYCNALIDARLSEMYNTKQMKYKGFEFRKLNFTDFGGTLIMYNGELCAIYYLTVNFDAADQTESSNACELLIPISVISK